jgi:1-aminocyclopropane-1-carboxylate deaminase
MSKAQEVNSRNHFIEMEILSQKGISLFVKREDEIHPIVSGNKWRKLKYHLKAAIEKDSIGILTFGGAYSNHIAATAYAAREAGLKAIGFIRGERIEPLNPTLAAAEGQGMELHFISRTTYRLNKEEVTVQFDPNTEFHHVPEGGADALGVQGCMEILTLSDKETFDIVCCSSGTGTTAAGLYQSLGSKQKLRVYPALKGDFARKDIDKLLKKKSNKDVLSMVEDYHFGGYAKTTTELFDFMRNFYNQTGMQTDPIYTGKMLFGLFEDIHSGLISEGSRILAIHTGGLQGIQGIEMREGIRLFDI